MKESLNLRFKYIVASSGFFVAHNVPKANYMIKHPEKYDDEQCYRMACKIINHMRRRSRTKTNVYGKENIPEENCILYSNHQGKYDALGILLGFGKPCGVLFGKKQGSRLVAKQTVGLLRGELIDLEDIKDTVKAIRNVGRKVKDGMNFLIFPEGGYADNRNELQEFKSGCFDCSLKSKKPILPVVIYDSYKSMNSNSLKKVTTQVHFLKPIPFDEYGHMNKAEIAELVKLRISEKLDMIKNKDKKVYLSKKD